jgi:superfamily II DNA/RNA helicase
MRFTDFALPEGIASRLEARGIITPTPIQLESLPFTLEGRDVLGRARTGTGKTLAFALPIITRLEVTNQRGRAPRAIVLAPTRELAKQVAREFEALETKLEILTIYGGTAYGPQEGALRRGVDVVVGTPGRVIDHLERGNLELGQVEIVVLDEADEMLSMGFQEAVEKVLETTPKERQTLLFSATVPSWVSKLANRYQINPVRVDLVRDESAVQASTTQHVAVRINPNARTRVLADLLTVYAPERAIIFTRTRKDCDELALELIHRGLEAEAIHGDLAQAQRERALSSFRAGRARVLVATDVAARGLDIPEVDLVVQHHFPQDAEAYVHRSGRTGRAGRSGTAVVLYTDREGRALRTLEHQTGAMFERRETPKPQDVRAAASSNAARQVRSLPLDVIASFRTEAAKLLEERGVDALASALAWIAGVHEAPRPTSLLTGEEGMTTLILRSPRLSVPRAVAVIAKTTGLESRAIGKIRLFGDGVVADVPDAKVQLLLNASPIEDSIEIERADVLPALLEIPRSEGSRDGGSRDRGDRGSRDGGFQRGYGRASDSRGDTRTSREGGRDGARTSSSRGGSGGGYRGRSRDDNERGGRRFERRR